MFEETADWMRDKQIELHHNLTNGAVKEYFAEKEMAAIGVAAVGTPLGRFLESTVAGMDQAKIQDNLYLSLGLGLTIAGPAYDLLRKPCHKLLEKLPTIARRDSLYSLAFFSGYSNIMYSLGDSCITSTERVAGTALAATVGIFGGPLLGASADAFKSLSGIGTPLRDFQAKPFSENEGSLYKKTVDDMLTRSKTTRNTALALTFAAGIGLAQGVVNMTPENNPGLMNLESITNPVVETVAPYTPWEETLSCEYKD